MTSSAPATSPVGNALRTVAPRVPSTIGGDDGPSAIGLVPDLPLKCSGGTGRADRNGGLVVNARTRGRVRGAVRSLGVAVVLLLPGPLAGQWEAWQERDRGQAGIPVSMFATFIAPGELIVYPFFEYYSDSDLEYEAGELGFTGTTERFGRYRASEGLIFLGYGISERWALELEGAVISARLEKDPADDSDLPPVLEQSGLGDVEGQVRYRWRPPAAGGGEIFSYLEVVLPLQKTKLLIGTPTWEFKFGTGYLRTLRWGTVGVRAAVEYAEGRPELGEYAIEYVRGLGRALRLYAGVEGSEDEVEMISEVQIRLADLVVLKLNNAFGLTRKATDWAPEVGVVIRFR